MRLWSVLGASVGASVAFGLCVYFVVGALEGSFRAGSKPGLEFAGDYSTVGAQEWKRLILAGNGLCRRYRLRSADQPVGDPEEGTWRIKGPAQIALTWNDGRVETGSVLGRALEIEGTRYIEPDPWAFGY